MPSSNGLLLLAIAQLVWVLAVPPGGTTFLAGAVAIALAIAAATFGIDRQGHRWRPSRRAIIGGALTLAVLAVAPLAHVGRVCALLVIVVVGISAPVVLLLRLWRRRVVDPALLAGAASAYVLFGMAFSMAYVLADAVAPSVDVRVAGGGAADTRDLVYFSYVTLTSTGYGDVVARDGLTRSMAIVETIAGELYLVVVLASVVSAMRSARLERPGRGEANGGS